MVIFLPAAFNKYIDSSLINLDLFWKKIRYKCSLIQYLMETDFSISVKQLSVNSKFLYNLLLFINLYERSHPSNFEQKYYIQVMMVIRRVKEHCIPGIGTMEKRGSPGLYAFKGV